MRFLAWTPYVALLALVAGVGGYISHLQGERAELAEYLRVAGLHADALEVSLDTTRLVAGRWERRATQVQIERDSLETALEQRPVVETVVTASAPAVVDTVFAEMTDSLLFSRFETELAIAQVQVQRFAPYEVEWILEVKPIVFELGVRCGPANRTTGIRSVEVTVEVELYDIDIDGSKIDPEVCNPSTLATRGTGGNSFWRGVGVGALAVVAALTLW